MTRHLAPLAANYLGTIGKQSLMYPTTVTSSTAASAVSAVCDTQNRTYQAGIMHDFKTPVRDLWHQSLEMSAAKT